jgi:hypothetical protein
MTPDEKHAWMALSLFGRALEEAVASGDAPLDLHIWLRERTQRWPEEFAWEDWSGYQPALRRVRLVREEERR